MHPESIVIVGPTSSGKSDLALLIADHLSVPVFNCDSVQIYKDLTLLSNKPDLLSEYNSNGEVVCTAEGKAVFDYVRYTNFSFHILRRKNNVFTVSRDLEALDFFKWLIRMGLGPEKIHESHPVNHYLFNIKVPGESYSAADFVSDVKRISEKEKLNTKIIAGGTMYYAYHYLMGTAFETNQDIQPKETESMNNADLLQFLRERDPEALSLVDNKNNQRLRKAVAYIAQHNKKFSESYYKKMNLRDDFLLIAIVPKSRETYVKSLESIVSKRITSDSIKEIDRLVSTYGHEILPWLQTVSYEYYYGVEIWKQVRQSPDEDLSHPAVKELILQLQIKERQYTKRQTTFMRKLEKDLINFGK